MGLTKIAFPLIPGFAAICLSYLLGKTQMSQILTFLIIALILVAGAFWAAKAVTGEIKQNNIDRDGLIIGGIGAVIAIFYFGIFSGIGMVVLLLSSS